MTATTAKIGEWIELKSENGFMEIISGAVELYVVYRSARRVFLREAKKGDFLCAVSEEQEAHEISLIAIATEETSLRAVSSEELIAAERSRQSAAIEGALALFSCRPVRSLLPRVCRELLPGERETVPAGMRLAVPKGQYLSWLELPRDAIEQDDSVRFVGTSDILFLEAQESAALARAAEVSALSTEEVIERFGMDFILSTVQEEIVRFCRAFSDYFRAEDKNAEERLSEFARTKELLLSNSYRELMKNLIPDLPFIQRAEDKNQPPVIHALREIGSYFGIPRSRFRLPGEAAHLQDARKILRALDSRDLHWREIDLTAGWHRQDIGPLIVFRGEKPFAMLPAAPDRYEYLDQEKGRRIPVTDEEAASFEPKAFCFVQAMPEDVDSIWKWLRWTVRLNWERDFWLLLLCCFIAGLIPIVTPLVTQTIFDDIIPSYDKKALLLVVQVMFVTSISGALISLVRGLTVMRLKNHARVSAESALWIKLLSLPAAFFRKYQTGDLALRMQGVSVLSNQISSNAANGIFNGLFCFWNLVVMFYYSYRMAILAIIVWAIFFVLSMIFSWRKVGFQRKKTDALGRVSGELLQILSGLNKFRLRAAEERAFYLWTKRFGDEWKWNRKSRWQDTWIGLIASAQPIVLNFCVFYYAISLLDMSQTSGIDFMTNAEFLSFNSAMGGFGSALNGLRAGIVAFWGVKPSLERILPILREKSEVSESKLPAGELTGEIEAAGVSFRYKPDAPLVLKNINLSIRPGTFVAIVGSSGSGKSTLLRVLIGLEKPESGAVLYDGMDLSDLDVSSVRRQIGVVMQHGQLMEGSIFSNIVGSLPLTMDDAWEVARLVGLEADIKELPMGMHTLVGEGGSTFSGGQRQRLLIARSLVHHPRIIVFDEATSSLDNETQAIVSSTLEKMRATRIIVAHRLSTIKNADRIIVLDRGVIAEDGTYDELMARRGIFHALAERQLI
ncbi:MAG: NHLP bacteriocin export ABC transporter permease/ATPase subunit [Schwartzia sp.]|nr:NHLP bacteriocin export ABC transporter permease/ATPase subunit [Schwartzia sp. (in: firmicutes)]